MAILLHFVALLGALIAPSPIAAEHWAIIAVGSNGYSNYRHQSDGCHAYHVVRRHGIPVENVVLMMYDDVAWHERNPFPGQLFNKPTTKNTTANAMVQPVDVYKGCNIDYRGAEVTPETFINVMIGNSSGAFGKKVLNSTADDRVFVNFVDHGSRGNVYFPHMKALTASRLKEAMKKMHEKKMYKELVFYMEACESGSMFSSSFMKSINAYVTTAANGFESSWATYCPPLDEVDGQRIGSCLGDLYSVNWMEDSDLTDLSGESLKNQFLRVKNETTKSHVKYFGAPKINKEIVGNFQSTYDKLSDDDDSSSDSNSGSEDLSEAVQRSVSSGIDSSVDAHDVDLVVAFYRYLRAAPGKGRRELAGDLISTIKAREAADEVFEMINILYEQQSNGPLLQVEHPTKLACHDEVTRVFQSVCTVNADPTGEFTSYSLKYAGTLLDLCESDLSQEAVLSLVRTACSVVERRHSFAAEDDVFNNNVAMSS
ncbi:hypothetical protein BBJ29_001103 [Phytophthora kernoviae]|uniref:legumain n=1 Tax=Phytophthora kernoviae TaxID=325452 RepID=A0A3R7JK70_9STRA|nr:hypothetical protein BBJ29_001103 [Phytophthora kernoviae]